ncbi:MAG: hypothetical protein O3B84_01870 [Chloroflexi bacterium]|nr:hypothetical protein [Chloroflexota bacterium]
MIDTASPPNLRREAVDLLVTNAFIVTMDDERRVWPLGALTVRGNRIGAIGSAPEIKRAVVARRTISTHGAVVQSGFIECHNHATLHRVRGAFGDTISWNDVVSQFYVPYWNTVSDVEEFAGAQLASLEMVRNGTTCFMEAGTSFEPDTVARAAALPLLEGRRSRAESAVRAHVRDQGR